MWRMGEAYWHVSASRRWKPAVTVVAPASDRTHRSVGPRSRVGLPGELPGVFAHELAQPLASILRNAEAAQQIGLAATVPAEIREILDDIIADVVRASAVMDRLHSLLTHGEVRRESVDLNQVVREALALMQGDLIRLNVSSAVFAHPDSLVLGDRVQLQQVLLNLIRNACEAMANNPLTQRRLTIATRLEADGETIECSVTDGGQGIRADSLERIFRPRVTTKCNGLGLGLAICRSIIEAHGGCLWAENASGGGAVFRFTARRMLDDLERPPVEHALCNP
jgi:C4-dicarboxylate-specific signal transduction histidine kinase